MCRHVLTWRWVATLLVCDPWVAYPQHLVNLPHPGILLHRNLAGKATILIRWFSLCDAHSMSFIYIYIGDLTARFDCRRVNGGCWFQIRLWICVDLLHLQGRKHHRIPDPASHDAAWWQMSSSMGLWAHGPFAKPNILSRSKRHHRRRRHHHRHRRRPHHHHHHHHHNHNHHHHHHHHHHHYQIHQPWRKMVSAEAGENYWRITGIRRLFHMA